jgi:hypothetical protein
MRNDQIFVLLLVVLLPMSGCFGGGVGDAEADEGVDVAEPELHHLYFENTTTLNLSANQLIEIVDSSVYKVFISNGTYGPWGEMNGETILIITGDCYPDSYSTNSQQTEWIYRQYHSTDNIFLHSNGNACSYVLGQDAYMDDGAEIGYVSSVVFRIHETVN